jgi:HK97 family phage major capsid protein
VKDIAEATAEQANKALDERINAKLDEFKSALPEVKAGYHVEVVEDEADKAAKENPFKSMGEFLTAVKTATTYGNVDKRLLPTKATGANEAIGSDGGFLIPEYMTAGVYERMYGVGSLLSLVQRDPVSGNNMIVNAVDETSRVNGSRHGGVTTYWLEEAGSITASKPKLRQISLKLKKVGALVYATDELLEDQSFMASFLSRVVPDELRFATEDAIFNGDGVGKPLGIMNSAARVDATRIDASLVSYADIINMWSRRWAGVNDYVWLVNQDVMPQLDLLIHNGTGSIPPRFVDYDAQGVMRMKGRPVLEVEYAQTLGTNGDIVLFSPSSYQLIDKAAGIQSAASIHVAFATAEQAFRFLYRVDGAPLWNSALTPFKGSNTQSPMVGLSTSS